MAWCRAMPGESAVQTDDWQRRMDHEDAAERVAVPTTVVLEPLR